MNTSFLTPQDQEVESSIQPKIANMIEDLFASLPDPKKLTSNERRGIIARYTESRPILLDNLNEEIRDCHPAMLRRFAIAAHAFPTDSDALAVHDDLTNMRLFLGRLSPVPTVLTMAFFEGFIQRFMAYLADLAAAQGSTEMEYTDVHGVCDIAHSQGLFRALSVEMTHNPLEPEIDLFEGVNLLHTLIQTIVHPETEKIAA
jgi:hypothetical protein